MCKAWSKQLAVTKGDIGGTNNFFFVKTELGLK